MISDPAPPDGERKKPLWADAFTRSFSISLNDGFEKSGPPPSYQDSTALSGAVFCGIFGVSGRDKGDGAGIFIDKCIFPYKNDTKSKKYLSQTVDYGYNR